jgi:hypothetical protein
LRLTNGEVDIIIPRAFGLRVLRYGRVGEANFLAEVPDVVIQTSLGDWRPRGGHRLWVSPESMPGSYAPDDAPIQCDTDDSLDAMLVQPTDATGIEKQMRVSLAPSGSRVTLTHLLVNRTSWPVAVASWGITVIRSDAVAVIPQPPFQRHRDALLPARPLVQWSFTDLTDLRWSIGSRLIQLKTDASLTEPQKVGAGNTQGWCAAVAPDAVYIKRFGWDRTATYPDFGCNNEIFSAGQYLEVEALGPIRVVLPGQSTGHTEHWYLFSALHARAGDEQSQSDALEQLVSQTEAA